MQNIYLLISIILYLCAPKEYSYSFCLANLIIFLLSIFLYYKDGGKAVSFTTFFSLSFFFVNFAYPIFIYPYDPYFILQFKYHFREIYINKGTSLSLMAIEAYLFALNRKKSISKSYYKNYEIKSQNVKIVDILFVLTFGYLCFKMVPQIGITYGDVEIPFQAGSLFVIITSVIITIACYKYRSVIRNNPKQFFLKTKFYLILSCLFIIVSSVLGSREYVISLGLLFLLNYSVFVNKIKTKLLVGSIVTGVVCLYAFSILRSGQNFTLESITQKQAYQKSDVNPLWNTVTDLLINNRNLYVGMEYTADENYGYTYGYHYIPTLFAPIPFVPDFISKTFLGKTAVSFTSQEMLTNYTRSDFGHSELDYELGSNCVVDVYMAWGMIGVLVMFYLLGVLIRNLEAKMNHDMYSFITYSILFGTSVFICRGGFFGPFRSVVWGLVILYFCIGLSVKKRKVIS